MKLPAFPRSVVPACLIALELGLASPTGFAAGPTNSPAKPPSTNSPSKVRFVLDDDAGDNALPKDDTEAKAAELSKKADEWMDKGNYAEAATVLEKATKLAPDNEELHFNLAFSYGRLGRTREAITQYRETLRILPEYSEAHNNLGNLLSRIGDVGGAVEHFKAAIKAQPENSSAHNNLGTALMRIGKPTEAVAQFEEAIRLRADYAEAWQNLGIARLDQRQVAAAADALDTALRLNPRLETARKTLARIRERARSASVAGPGGQEPKAASAVNAPPSSAPR